MGLSIMTALKIFRDLDDLTALEIFTNPSDLEIAIGRKNGDGKYFVIISRGPRHRFKPMFDSNPFASELEDAVGVIKTILESSFEVGMNEFGERDDLVAQVLNPRNEPIDLNRVMNPELISRILAELRQHQTVSTCNILAVPT